MRSARPVGLAGHLIGETCPQARLCSPRVLTLHSDRGLPLCHRKNRNLPPLDI